LEVVVQGQQAAMVQMAPILFLILRPQRVEVVAQLMQASLVTLVGLVAVVHGLMLEVLQVRLGKVMLAVLELVRLIIPQVVVAVLVQRVAQGNHQTLFLGAMAV
jgi:hypothetical protein